ncbi:MAG: alpha/beta hydrolase [Oceanospirillaceae bacterium]|nr:alpha/beta hydrolase [Oceanospirillaceae bacterium]
MRGITSVFMLVLMLLTGCTSLTSLMFYPRQDFPVKPDQIGLHYETVIHFAQDGTALVSWFIPAQGEGITQAKGSILYLHGNAQNISYHLSNVAWLAAKGYNLFLLDYREYGGSEGLAKIPEVFLDAHSAMHWLVENRPLNEPLFMLGQSMGASIAAVAMGSSEDKSRFAGLILDAGFASFPGIAVDAMTRHWFLYPLALPALTISNDYDPEDFIGNINMPLLEFHSRDDQVVPFAQGEKLFSAATEPKQLIETHGAHILTFANLRNCQILLDFLTAQLPVQDIPVNH